MTASKPTTEERHLYGKVLVELGELRSAEEQVALILEEEPADLTALSLYAKIKHMRGELSQAIACWAQIHLRSPHNETALMQLTGMLHLAKDPERGAGEYMALGGFQLARKPVAQMELEEVFRIYLSRQPVEARARCAQLATKYRASDRETYKLIMLAGAWIAELSSDFTTAATSLESLGAERGFEDDVDRILALVRVYEQIGTDEKLRAAVNICRHLERRFEKISTQSRLAALYARLGETALAQEYERQYLESFRRRMHRPTLHEVVRVAARRYLPLERLRSLQPATNALPADLPTRERALARALAGDFAAARASFADGADVLDRKYLADLDVLEGQRARAARGYVEALASDPEDLQVLGWLLDHAAELDAKTAEYFRDPAVSARAHELLQEAIRATPLRATLWRQLAALASLQPGDAARAEAERCHKRADALVAQRDDSAIGRVLAAGVYRFIAKSKGLIHEIWAARQPAAPGQGGWLPESQILGNLTAEMKQGVAATFMAVREYARAKFPHLIGDLADYNYSFRVTKEDEPSGGLSAGLPTAVACLSVFLQRPVPGDAALSGVIVADAHDVLTVKAIADAEYKVKAAYNRNLRALLLPSANAQELARSRQVPTQIGSEIVRFVGSLDQAVAVLFGESIFFDR
jgi:tetratricopeptide (TPR) repeat protein